MKGIINECQLMERCDGNGVGVMGWKGYDGGVRKSWKV